MKPFNQPDAGHAVESQQAYTQARQSMVANIRDMAAADRSWVAGARSEKVLAVMSRVPRHCFVPQALRPHAYGNHPLPIGHDQTIGTGSGYQAAVLSGLAGQVYSLEVVPQLAASVARLLAALGYANVSVKAGDGCLGWPVHAPYDRIIVTAAAKHIPQPLLDQLKPGGRLVIPVGGHAEFQQLQLITKDAAGQLQHQAIEPVRFVPFIGAE
ncbi:MAG: protein-L-isoaspartate(D-aspartate) O-methyltransferase [Comamonadaceae bacterium]|nr:MAG: protein-L-isoaspartate(D-aspartate) O-methyltransferase [Comamonadaceae bacterium]